MKILTALIVIQLTPAEPPKPTLKRLEPYLYEAHNPLKYPIRAVVDCGMLWKRVEIDLRAESVEKMLVQVPDKDSPSYCTIESWKEIKPWKDDR